MSRKYLIAFLLLLSMAVPFAASADSFYVEPADLELGKTEKLRFVLENSQEYFGFQAEVKLPAGLQVVKNSDGEPDVTLSSRADGGNYMVNSNMLDDGVLIMSAFSANRTPFSGDSGLLLDLNVLVTENFAGGTVELSDVMFIDSQDKDVEFDSTSAFLGITVTGIALSKTELSLTEDETAALTVTFTPANASNQGVTWSSSDESVAVVSLQGLITAKQAGTATITATSANGLTASCEVTVAAKVIEVTGITLSNTELKITEGETATLTATVAPDNATDKSVTWTSSDASIASVSSDGVVTALKPGNATITATSSNGKTATCAVTVAANIISVESITISKTELSLTEGDTATLTATIAPENATDKTVTWTSSDASIATVSADGTVTAVKAGTATITAASANGKTATCSVTVADIYYTHLT
ncbi:MAG: Ig domain-containing protein, partial [Muribaculaceae bacterium]|nr:Ig domain-containing protein [Muribaculaceae bacterium]